eukprot:1158016-Pelagomonas_calceolata.AAC.2
MDVCVAVTVEQAEQPKYLADVKSHCNLVSSPCLEGLVLSSIFSSSAYVVFFLSLFLPVFQFPISV